MEVQWVEKWQSPFCPPALGDNKSDFLGFFSNNSPQTGAGPAPCAGNWLCPAFPSREQPEPGISPSPLQLHHFQVYSQHLTPRCLPSHFPSSECPNSSPKHTKKGDLGREKTHPKEIPAWEKPGIPGWGKRERSDWKLKFLCKEFSHPGGWREDLGAHKYLCVFPFAGAEFPLDQPGTHPNLIGTLFCFVLFCARE